MLSQIKELQRKLQLFDYTTLIRAYEHMEMYGSNLPEAILKKNSTRNSINFST